MLDLFDWVAVPIPGQPAGMAAAEKPEGLPDRAMEFYNHFADEMKRLRHLDKVTQGQFELTCIQWDQVTQLAELAEQPETRAAFDRSLELFRLLAGDFGIFPRAEVGAWWSGYPQLI